MAPLAFSHTSHKCSFRLRSGEAESQHLEICLMFNEALLNNYHSVKRNIYHAEGGLLLHCFHEGVNILLSDS